MFRASLMAGAFAIAFAGCSAKEGTASSGGSGGFPENGLAKVRDKLKQGESDFDHALLARANDARARMRAEEIRYVDLKKQTDELRAAIEAIALDVGFEDIEQFDKAYNDLMGLRLALGRLRGIDGPDAGDFQTAVARELVKDYTEADLRFVAGLE